MKKILLLDDNLDIVQIVEEVLVYENFEVRTLQTAAGFFEVAEEFLPDLIILDYRLADGNGAELCREIKAVPRLKTIPIIIFSAYTMQGMDFRQFGCDAFIAKPFDIDALIETVLRLIHPEKPQLQKA